MGSFRDLCDIEHNGVNGLRPSAGLQFSKRHRFVPYGLQRGWFFRTYLYFVALFCLTLAFWMRSLYFNGEGTSTWGQCRTTGKYAVALNRCLATLACVCRF